MSLKMRLNSGQVRPVMSVCPESDGVLLTVNFDCPRDPFGDSVGKTIEEWITHTQQVGDRVRKKFGIGKVRVHMYGGQIVIRVCAKEGADQCIYHIGTPGLSWLNVGG